VGETGLSGQVKQQNEKEYETSDTHEHHSRNKNPKIKKGETVGLVSPSGFFLESTHIRRPEDFFAPARNENLSFQPVS
jgi:hypothetical protein